MTEAPSAFEPSPETERFLCERLLDAGQPIAERFRALFSLRNLRGDAPRSALLQGLTTSLRCRCSSELQGFSQIAGLVSALMHCRHAAAEFLV